MGTNSGNIKREQERTADIIKRQQERIVDSNDQQ